MYIPEGCEGASKFALFKNILLSSRMLKVNNKYTKTIFIFIKLTLSLY